MVRYLQLYFTDLLGVFRSTSIVWEGDDVSRECILFDGSSVYGFEPIEYSDLVVKPVPDTLTKLPWEDEVYAVISGVYKPSGERHSRDPRYIVEKTIHHIRGYGYECYAGVEMEFFLFNSVKAFVDTGIQYLEITSIEAPWSDGVGIALKKGYHVVEPVDCVASVRRKIIDIVHEIGFKCVKNHHEVASSGQVEVTSNRYSIDRLGDFIQFFKMVARKVARDHGFEAVFLPKPLWGDNGSGMHIHVSLWRDGENLFFDPSEEYGLTQLARYFIGGVLEHGRSLSAIVSPTVNSYKRLVPGFEAPVYLVWGLGNRSVAVRIPVLDHGSPDLWRIEYRPPDPTANPYLALAALFLAGLDGILKKIDPGDPVIEDVYKWGLKKRRELGVRELPRNLEEALDELESDHEYLKPVFTDDVLETYIELKRRESREVSSVPAPMDFLYYSIL